MTPDTLQAISSAKGVPISEAKPPGMSELMALLSREVGRTGNGKSTRVYKAPQWTMAECAQACVGMNQRHFYALRYSYAGDESVYSMLRLWLWEWSLEQREHENAREEKWPRIVPTVNGHQKLKMMPLVEAALSEEFHGGRIALGGANYVKPDVFLCATLGLTPMIWGKRVSPIYEAIRTEYVKWLSIGEGGMRRWIRGPTDDAG